jgi:hypothetical protein
MRRAILLAMMLSACAVPALSGPVPLSIDQVLARHPELDGQRVRVRGWLSLCQSLSCWMTTTPDKNARPFLSIGSSSSFDRAVAKWVGREVVIDATLNDECLRPDIICTDRADVLSDPVLVRVL